MLRRTRAFACLVIVFPSFLGVSLWGQVKTTGAAPAIPAQALPLFPATKETARAYSQIALWAKAFHPPRPEPLQLSASAIDAYERCPAKYMFQYMWNNPLGETLYLRSI